MFSKDVNGKSISPPANDDAECNTWDKEMKKLISYSGTPTVIWRRTGEICLVAPEFCMLTEWGMEELVGRKKYIYEVQVSSSTLSYLIAKYLFPAVRKSVRGGVLGKLCDSRV